MSKYRTYTRRIVWVCLFRGSAYTTDINTSPNTVGPLLPFEELEASL
jgi:hypothetical protein